MQMNKQEAIEKIKNIDTLNINDIIAGQSVDMVIKNQVIDIISQIDEPQKPVVPKLVAEWIKKYKENGCRLANALDDVFDDVELSLYIKRQMDDYTEIIAKAWLSYPNIIVEQEKLYTVEIPNPNINTHTILQKVGEGLVLIMVTNARWRGWAESKLTEAEIKEDFEWAWQWAKEVE